MFRFINSQKSKIAALLLMTIFISLFQTVVRPVMVHAEETYGSWISDDAYYKAVYGKSAAEWKEEADKPLKEEALGLVFNAVSHIVGLGQGMILFVLADIFSDDFCGALAGEVSKIILGKVAMNRSAELYTFSLDDKNIYGKVGALGYVILRGICYVVMAIMLAFLLLKAALGPSTGKSLNDLKDQLVGFAIGFAALAFWPNVLDLLIYIRDSILHIIYTSPLVLSIYDKQSGKGVSHIFASMLESFFTENLSAKMILAIGTQVVVGYFMILYVSMALMMAMLFMLAPLVFVLSVVNKEMLETWFMTVIGTLVTPCIDYVLMMIVFLIGAEKHPYLQLAAAMAVIPTRGIIRQMLGLGKGALSEASGLGVIMAGMALGKAAFGIATKGADKLGKIASDKESAEQEDEIADKLGEPDAGEEHISAPGDKTSAGQGKRQAPSPESYTPEGKGGDKKQDGSDRKSSQGGETEQRSVDTNFDKKMGTSAGSSADGIGKVSTGDAVINATSDNGDSDTDANVFSPGTEGIGAPPGDNGNGDTPTSDDLSSESDTESGITTGAEESQDADSPTVQDSGELKRSTSKDARKRNLEDMDNIRNHVEMSKKRLADAQANVAKENSNIAAIRKDAAASQAKIDNIQKALDENNAKLNAEGLSSVRRDELDKENGELGEQLADEKNTLKGHELRLESAKGRLKSAEANVAALQKQIAGGEAAIAEGEKIEAAHAAFAGTGTMGQTFSTAAEYENAQVQVQYEQQVAQARTAQVMREYASVKNFEMPQYRNNLSHRQLAAFYRRRADRQTVQLVGSTAGAIAGATVLGGAGLYLGAPAIMQGASAGINYGSTAGSGAAGGVYDLATKATPVPGTGSDVQEVPGLPPTESTVSVAAGLAGSERAISDYYDAMGVTKDYQRQRDLYTARRQAADRAKRGFEGYSDGEVPPPPEPIVVTTPAEAPPLEIVKLPGYISDGYSSEVQNECQVTIKSVESSRRKLVEHAFRKIEEYESSGMTESAEFDEYLKALNADLDDLNARINRLNISKAHREQLKKQYINYDGSGVKKLRGTIRKYRRK